MDLMAAFLPDREIAAARSQQGAPAYLCELGAQDWIEEKRLIEKEEAS